MKIDMVYVAVNPETPDVAYALCVDNPEWKKLTAETLADWIKEGATVKHVTHELGCRMLMEYIRLRGKNED